MEKTRKSLAADMLMEMRRTPWQTVQAQSSSLPALRWLLSRETPRVFSDSKLRSAPHKHGLLL